MSVILVDGAGSGNAMTVDPTSKAARVTLVDPAGREIVRPLTGGGGYLAGWIVRQAGATAAATQVVAFVNTSSTIVVRVRAVRMIVLFDGTAPGAQGRRYYTIRTTGAAATGATQITPTKKKTTAATSVVDMRVNAAGVGVSAAGPLGVGDPMWVHGISVDTTGKFQPFEYPLANGDDGDDGPAALRSVADVLTLKFNEGLGIFTGDTSVAGVGNVGYIEWDEATA